MPYLLPVGFTDNPQSHVVYLSLSGPCLPLLNVIQTIPEALSCCAGHLCHPTGCPDSFVAPNRSTIYLYHLVRFHKPHLQLNKALGSIFVTSQDFVGQQ